MSCFIVEGGRDLRGECIVNGAKNSILPLLAASFLCHGQSIFTNCPALSDVETAAKILTSLGADVSFQNHMITVDASRAENYIIPENLMHEMRSSIIFLGAVASKTKRAIMSYPGGCELGARPIDIHLKALSKMGMTIKEQHGSIDCSVENDLVGCSLVLDLPSVGATENIIIASVKAKGTTVIYNAAMEPEIKDLADYLNLCGAKIMGAGGNTIRIDGVDKLSGCEWRVMPDRIEASTFVTAAAANKGDILIRSVIPETLNPVLEAVSEMGCVVTKYKDSLHIKAPKRLKGAGMIRTMPYPGFPTDAQAIMMASTCVANGTSTFVENIFDSRFKHVGQLLRMGAKIKTEGRMAVVEGVPKLYGADVVSPDLRGGAALLIAAMAAEGTSRVYSIEHIDRGYEKPEEVFSSLGAMMIRQ